MIRVVLIDDSLFARRLLSRDEASSVVRGMPRAAVELGAADEILPLERMANRLSDVVQRVPSMRAVQASRGA